MATEALNAFVSSSASQLAGTSITHIDSVRPTCCAARPTPFALYIVSSMSAARFRSAGVTDGTGTDASRSTFDPYFTTSRIISPWPFLANLHSLHDSPVEPNPPAPLSVASSASTSTTSARATGATTICAILMPFSTVNGSWPKLASITHTSPL